MNSSEYRSPYFSIIIVTYNSQLFIKETIQSCLNQDFNDFEIIISDDKSSDNTWQIIEKFEDRRIRKFRQNVNLGEYANRNFCIKKSRGKFVIFIDGEDILYGNGLSFIKYYTGQFENHSMFIAKPWDEKIVFPKIITSDLFLKLEFLDKGICALNFTKIIFNREIFISLGAFDKIGDIKLGDLYLQYLLGTRNELILIPDGFSWWRRRKGQASESLINNYGYYFTEYNKFRFDFFELNKSSFSNIECKRALINYFGVFFRFLFKRFIYLKFRDFAYLISRNKSIWPYFWTIFYKFKNSYLKNYSGENPL